MTGGLGRCHHRDQWLDDGPHGVRHRSRRCRRPAEWVCPGRPGGGHLCDDHARQWVATQPLPCPVDRGTTIVGGDRHGDPTDWRVPAWAVDHWQHRLDQLRHRTAPDPAHADQPALFDLGAHP